MIGEIINEFLEAALRRASVARAKAMIEQQLGVPCAIKHLDVRDDHVGMLVGPVCPHHEEPTPPETWEGQYEASGDALPSYYPHAEWYPKEPREPS